MARYSIPQKTLKPNIKVRKSRKGQNNTSFGGFSAVRMVWDTLSMNNLIDKAGFHKNGIPVQTLVFAGIAKSILGKTSNIELENSSTDPVLQRSIGYAKIDEVTFSHFLNDNRYDWSCLLEESVKQLNKIPQLSSKANGYLIIDDTAIKKFGVSMR